MSESTPLPTAPIQKRRRRLSPIWIIPLVAAALGLWLVWTQFAGKGPLITVTFETAEGIIAGQTPVQCKSVTVGVVESVHLTDDLKGVVAMMRINKDAESLLRTNTKIWVVRARFGGGSISGLGTLVSGSFIEIDPDRTGEPRRDFQGLENPPVTPQGVPGLHLTLVSDEAGSLGVGSPVTYKGLRAGKIETREFDPATGQVRFGVFVDEMFAPLITTNSRFWNVSGFDVELGTNGVRLRTGTLESMVYGGVTFNEPDPGISHLAAKDSTMFLLYKSEDDSHEMALNPRLTYLLLFEDSVRGLAAEAPVEFRGIPIGRVIGVSFDYLTDNPDRRVPVLIKIDPSLISNLPQADLEAAKKLVEESVGKGLRASLKTGSLLTGQLFIDLDFKKDDLAQSVTVNNGYEVIPTVSTGLARIEDKLVSVLDKVQKLPLENTIDKASEALAQLKEVTASLNTLIASDDTQAIPGDLRETLDSVQKTLAGFDANSSVYRDLSVALKDLSSALRSVDALSSTIERKPNSLIFGSPGANVPPPKGKR